MTMVNNKSRGVPYPRNKQENPLCSIGFLKNIKTCIDELNVLIGCEEQKLTKKDALCLFDKLVESNQFRNYNNYGYGQQKDGSAITEDKAQYKLAVTNLLTKNNEKIVGWFARGNRSFEGVCWGTMAEFRAVVESGKKFRIGDFFFDKWDCGLLFLEELAKCTIPETWVYRHQKSNIGYPILKSYIENIFNRLKKEKSNGTPNKIIFSQDHKWMMFNTNLLDKYFHEIIIVAEVRNVKGNEVYFNPKHSKGVADRLSKTFNKDDEPCVPKFFENVNEVVFQTKWTVDRDFDKFTHIIEERVSRFPDEYKDKSPEDLARKLDNAIGYAVSIAQRNYKFVVPMYRPQTDTIQLLMPIYLDGTFQQCPDFALVLTPDVENEIYMPETILPLDAAYQNARLIAKPDETWLNPNNI